jgi:hypothetical protein
VIRQDYLERMIQQLAAAIARIADLAREGKHEQAGRELDGCYRSLGVTRDMLERLDATTLGAMLGVGKAEAVARVLDAEADLARSQGREADALAKSRDAAALRRAVALVR